MRKFLTLSFLFFLFFFVGLGKINPAQAACTQDPTWIYLGHTDGAHDVNYHFKLINNCPGLDYFLIEVTGLPTNPQEFHGWWQVEGGNRNTTVKIGVTGSKLIDIKVTRDLDYYHKNGTYTWVTFKATMVGASSSTSKISEDYIVVNRPDLVITKFNFPGGNTCETSDVALVIKNIGWAKVTGSFGVKVFNGKADTNTKVVSADLSHDEVKNLSEFFKNMARPPIGDWKAEAEVDYQNNIYPEVFENNNTKIDNYTTTKCPVTPAPTLSISSTPTPSPYPTKIFTPTPTKRLTPTPTKIFTPTPTKRLTPTPTPPLTPPPPSTGKWIQSVGGDVREDQRLAFRSNKIPDGKFLSENDPPQHGVVFLSSPYNLGVIGPAENFKANKSGWLVRGEVFNPALTIKTSYALMVRNLTRNGTYQTANKLFGEGSPCDNGSACDLNPISPGIYKTDEYNNSVTIKLSSPDDEFEFPSGKYVVLINKNLNIENNIKVPKGSSVIFIVNGDINIASNVTRIDGIYSTDNNFIVKYNPSGTDEQLIINGNIIANANRGDGSTGTFQGGRKLENENEAGVKVVIRPDLILNSPAFVHTGSFNREEVAPGE